MQKLSQKLCIMTLDVERNNNLGKWACKLRAISYLL